MQINTLFLALPSFVTDNFVLLLVALFGVIGLIAIICGAFKGVTRMSNGPVIWALAFGGFVLLRKLLGSSNFVKDMFTGSMGDDAAGGAASLVVAVVAVIIVLFICGIIGAICGKVRRRRIRNYYLYNVTGHAAFDREYNAMQQRAIEKTIRRLRPGFIKFCDAFFGALFGMLNVLIVVAFIFAAVLLTLNATPLAGGALGDLFEINAMTTIMKYVTTYTLDFALVGIMIAMIVRGYRIGVLLRGIRGIILVFGTIAAIVGGFALPFLSPITDSGKKFGFIGDISSKVGGLFEGMVGDAGIAGIIGKIIVGFVLCIILVIFVKLLAWLIKLLARKVRRTTALRVIDGGLSALIMAVIAVIVCFIIVAVLYVLEHYGVFGASSKIFSADSPFAKSFYSVCDKFIKPLLEKLVK